jgi:hypothetical protein
LALSEETKTTVSRSSVLFKNDLYPDRSATPTSAGVFPIRDTGESTQRLADEIPRTTQDMNKLFMWQHGEVVRGTQAEEHVGMKRYMEDINRDFGQELTKKDIYIDTLDPKRLVSRQLEDFKNL